MKIFLSHLFVLFLITSCESLINPEPELPPITTEGKNTFGCLVNGEVWLPKGGINNPKLNVSLSNSGEFELQAFRDADRETIQLYFIDCCDENLNSEINSFPFSAAAANLGDCFFETDSSAGHFEILEYSPRDFIMAGTFEFTIEDECDTIRVTEGRFDVRYR